MKHVHTISFKHAFAGLLTAFKTQPNFRVHTFAAILVILAGYLFSINPAEWIILVFAIGLVMVAELINTAIEATVDLLTSQHNQYAKIAKDVAAAAVLLSAGISVLIGLIIFLPKII